MNIALRFVAYFSQERPKIHAGSERSTGRDSRPACGGERVILLVVTTLLLSGIACAQASGQSAGAAGVSNPTPDGIKFADKYRAASVGEQINKASSDCKGQSCLVIIPPTLGPGVDKSPSDNTVYIDFRPKTYKSNPVHIGVNITDGRPRSDWAVINSGGLPRAKLWVASSPESTAYPGDVTAVFSMNPAGGIYPGGVQPTSDESLGVLLHTQANTDTLT